MLTKQLNKNILKSDFNLSFTQVFKRIKNILAPFIIPIIILIIWEATCRAGLVPRIVLPPPSEVGKSFITMAGNGELLRHLSISLLRVLEGYLIGSALGTVLGILMGLFKSVEKYLSLICGVLRPIPVMAWVPLIILWMGIDESSKVTLIAIGTFWTVLVNVTHGIKSADKKYTEVAYIFEKNKYTLLTKVVFPSALPFIFTGLRVGVDVAWRSVVGAEVVAAASGMGYLIQFSRELGQTDAMLVGIFCIGLMGLLIDFILRKLQKVILKWDQSYGNSN